MQLTSKRGYVQWRDFNKKTLTDHQLGKLNATYFYMYHTCPSNESYLTVIWQHQINVRISDTKYKRGKRMHIHR